MKLEYVSKTLRIYLPKLGVYKMGGYSSTGKSYLREMLNRNATGLVESGINCACYSNAFEYSNIEETILSIKDHSLIIFDRLDLFENKRITSLIESIAPSMFILMDFKEPTIVSRQVIIKIGSNSLEVIGD